MRRNRTIRGDERGFALVLTLVIMAAMTAIGLAAIVTSSTDMLIARNDRETKQAFYIAETGIAEAIGRMDLASGHARFIGEDSAEKEARRLEVQELAPSPVPFANRSFPSSVVNLAGMGGSYMVTVDYAYEGSDTWSDGDGTLGEIVLYCTDFGFSGRGVPTNCFSGGHPVYVIDSVATTDAGVKAATRLYVAASSLNVIPPGDTILFTEGDINVQVAGGVDGMVGTTSGTVTGNCPDASCSISSSGFPDYTNGDMPEYLGMSMADLKAYADPPSPYSQSGPSVVNYNPVSGAWGSVCNTCATNDPACLVLHICDNDAKFIYIDNAGAGVGAAKVASNFEGRGIIVVTGDLNLAGTILWEGMIYVMGTMEVNGTVTVYGTVMVQGNGAGVNPVDVAIKSGGLDVFGSIPIATSVADEIGLPKLLRWSRQAL